MDHHSHHSDTHHDHTSHHKAPESSPWQNPVIIAAIIVAVGLIIGGGLFFLASQKGPATITDQNKTLDGNRVVQIIEFSDFECPFCANAYPTIEQVRKTYGDKIQFTYKHFPLRSIHPLAQKAAEASECARLQGKFEEYYQTLFSKHSEWAQTDGITKFKQYAGDLGLNTGSFNTCLDSDATKDAVEKDYQEGISKGVSGTPAFFIDGDLISGAQPFEAFKTKIDAKLGGATTPTKTDPVIELTIINDSTCAECQKTSAQLVATLKGNLLPTVNATTVEFNSTQGQELAQALGVTAIPAFVFSSNVKEAASYAQLANAFEEKDGKIKFVDGVASQFGAVKWLQSPQAGNSPSIGDANAKVTIIQFSDFQCPFCKKFFDETEKELLKKYEGKIHFVYKEFPLESIHPNAKTASIAALCANEQGKYLTYHDQLFNQQATWSADTNVNNAFKQYAKDLNLNTTQFNDCLDNQKTKGLVEADLQLGSSFGVSGTPSFFINGLNLAGAYPIASFTSIIDAELAK